MNDSASPILLMSPLALPAYLVSGGNNLWATAALAVFAPIGPVLVGYVLTRRKLREQDKKVQEIHVLVNSRLSKALDALSSALVENIELKRRLGIEVPASLENQARLDPETVSE